MPDLPPSWSGRVAELRNQVGRRVADDEEPHVEYATVDSIRHFARAYGDDNPLYCDPGYAVNSCQGTTLAPPLFPIATGVAEPVGVEHAAAGSTVDLDRVLGVAPVSVVGDTWHLHRPITGGARLMRARTLLAVEPTHEGESGGACDVTVRTRYVEAGRLYAVHERTRRYLARASADAAVRPPTRPRATYSAAQLARIGQAYERQSGRGAMTRRIEEVHRGEAIGPMVKGPLTLTDLITYRAGVGPGPLGAAVLDLAHRHRRSHPERYAVDESGVPDTIERRHWDEHYAQSLGHPSAYDYSHTRLCWFSHLLTNWMGDGGWLWTLSARVTAPAYIGDTHWMQGRVTDISDGVEISEGRDGCDGRGPLRVTVALEGRNQLDDVTCRGEALVLLPNRMSLVAHPPG